MKIAVRLEFNHFDAIAKKLPRAVAEIVENSAWSISADVTAKMHAVTPPSEPGGYPAVDIGNLAASYRAGTVPLKPDGTVWIVGTDADYAAPLEYGHHTKSGGFVAARPHLTPSAEAERPRFIGRMKKLEEHLR